MGGINHQPTSQVSMQFTVPGARALTMAMAEIFLGNVAIEDVILTPTTQFGVGRQHLIEATDHFGRVVTQLTIVKSYVKRVIDTIGNDEYNPFDLSTIDAAALIQGAIDGGLLPDDVVVKEALEATIEHGYTGIFFEISDRIDAAIEKASRLHELTASMVDGPEGTQGYFWLHVETNKNTWRQDFMQALTALDHLVHFWTTTAVICTEVHLTGINSPSLLAHNVRA
jgi:hypothetical protein